MMEQKSKPQASVKTQLKIDQNIPIKTKHYRDGKKRLALVEKKGQKLDTCASKYNDYVCCNVKVLKAVSNCPYDCTYCFLQNYLTDGTTQVVKDTPALMQEVHDRLAQQPWRFFRIGTWELGDSLALESHSGQAAALIKEFATLNNVVLELKTKSDEVDNILDIDHQGKTVVSWSLNTHEIIDKEEHKTASLDKRLAAMKKVADAGYLIGLHFDPMIWHPTWKEGYTDLVEKVFQQVSIEQVAWVSIGSLRFNPEQKRKMENNFPGSTMLDVEMVAGNDNKVRYVKPLRLEMYKHLYQELQKHQIEQTVLYFCMERWDVWESVFAYSPKSIGELDYLFAKSMCKRFPHLKITEPKQAMYELFQDS